MANTTLGGVTLHDGSNSIIIENDCRKEAYLTVMSLYLKDSDITEVFDVGGVAKYITLVGVYISSTVAGIKTWIDSVEALIQGHQDKAAGYPLTFTDDLRGTVKVKLIDFNSTYSGGSKTQINWTLKIVESSENA